MSGVHIRLPAMLTVEEDDVYDPADRYGDPIKKIIFVKFGDHQVARYELLADSFGEFYYDDPHTAMLHIRYDTPEEFVAMKLKHIFALVG